MNSPTLETMVAKLEGPDTGEGRETDASLWLCRTETGRGVGYYISFSRDMTCSEVYIM